MAHSSAPAPHPEDWGGAPPTAALLPVTVDLVVLTVRAGTLQVLLVERLLEPFRGARALPGGFVLPNERLEAAARRELEEETGVAPSGHLEQLRTYGPLGRDPRGPVLSVAHLLLAPDFDPPRPGGDAASAAWYPVARTGPLAFDHDQILADGVERARAKLEYSPLATAFCAREFTVAQLRAVYEAVWGAPLDPRNFHRKATGTPGFLEETGRRAAEGSGRPATLYRLAPDAESTVLNPPLMRP